MAFVSLWDIALTPEDIQQHKCNVTALLMKRRYVAHWKFEEDEGNVVIDFSGGGNHGQQCFPIGSEPSICWRHLTAASTSETFSTFLPLMVIGGAETAWQCGDLLEYQGYDYETVQIGEQCWFAENLQG